MLREAAQSGERGLIALLDSEQWLPRPVDEIFAFFANPRNLERITPPFLSFCVLATSTEAIREGTVIDYRLRLHGLPLRWQSRIECWQPGRLFVDRQLHGPYALWHHTHEFEPAAGGTVVRDRVRYRLPFGGAGRLIAGRLVARDLGRIFSYRRGVLASVFSEANTSAGLG